MSIVARPWPWWMQASWLEPRTNVLPILQRSGFDAIL
jgi:hypothetical protein